MYPSGWRVRTRNGRPDCSFRPPENPAVMRVYLSSKKWIFCCSFRQFFPKPFSIEKRRGKTAAEHRGRVIEVVITSRTRNAVVRKGTWVRIPPSPPTKPVIAMVTGFWIFWKSLFLPDFQWAELLNTWAELLRFLKNTGCPGSKIAYIQQFFHLLSKQLSSGNSSIFVIASAEEIFDE